MTFDLTNPYYYMYPLLAVALFFLLYFILRFKSQRTQSIVLFAILAANFALHFLKLLFPPYSQKDFTVAIQTITPENVCAINTMAFPFLFFKKKGVARDYMFYLGVISGIGASLFPQSIESAKPFDFDAIRYYFCHTTLWAVPLLMVVLHLHRLNYRRIWMVPLIYMLELAVIVVNEVVLVSLGYDSLWNIMSSDHGNGGLAFGPSSVLDGTLALKILLAVTPACFTPDGTGSYYVPVLWQLFPTYIYGCPIAFIMAFYWERNRFIGDLKAIYRRTMSKLVVYRLARRKVKYRAAYRTAHVRRHRRRMRKKVS